MRRLLLLRHAKAEAHSPDGDFDRALKPRGRADAARLGAWLAAHGHAPDAVLASPSRRTRETVEIVLAAAAKPVEPEFHEAIYNASAETIRAVIAGERAASVLVVGHNPGIGELAHLLAGPDAGKFAAGYPTCALAIFEAVPGAEKAPWSRRFRLLSYLTPASLRH
jgi:phosphohistidine phosphatase